MTRICPYHEDAPGDVGRASAVWHVETLQDVFSYVLVHFPALHPEWGQISQRYAGYDRGSGWDCWLISLKGVPVLWADGPLVGLPRIRVV